MAEQPEMREARLRPEFAPLYPGLEPGAWQDAAVLAEQVLSEHLLRPSPGYMLSDRVLAKEHFEFRGGDPLDARGLPAHVATIRLSKVTARYKPTEEKRAPQRLAIVWLWEEAVLLAFKKPPSAASRRAGGK